MASSSFHVRDVVQFGNFVSMMLWVGGEGQRGEQCTNNITETRTEERSSCVRVGKLKSIV